MDFRQIFKQTESSVTRIAKNVGDSSKKLAARTKLKKKIFDLEGMQKDAYAEIGKLYFAKHADCAEEPYAEWIQKIVEAGSEIAKCQREIAALDDSTICPECGKHVAMGQNFCSNCGARQEEPVEEEPVEEVAAEVVTEAATEVEEIVAEIVAEVAETKETVAEAVEAIAEELTEAAPAEVEAEADEEE